MSVWWDHWIPRPRMFKILMPPHPSMEDLIASELNLQENRAWTFELLKELFDEEEVHIISSIPLSFRWAPDRIMWHYDKKALFSVKSTYKVALEMCVPVDLMASSSSSDGGAYRGLLHAIWRAWIPPKVKICGWRVYNDILPTRTNLATK